MEFFLDTANLEEIKTANQWGIVDGITTNPTLIAKENEDYHKRLKDISQIIKGPISGEVISTKYEEMIEEAKKLANIAENIVVKIPIIEEGLKAINKLTEMGIKTNVTLCFSANQALLAAKCGATYISPFLGRIDDIGQDGLELISDIRIIYDNYNFDTKILAASIRNPYHVYQCAKIGADVGTMPFSTIKQLVKHPLTDIGLAKFLDDYKKAFS